jgi:CubicO group peptidase (beta-lactamase class C family)
VSADHANREAGAGLVDATQVQERRFARAFRLVDEAIRRKAFPGAALAVTLGGELVAWRAFGRFTYEADSPEVKPGTVWDLASLTKPLATTAMAMLLWERGKLSLETAVARLLPEFADAPVLAEQGPGGEELDAERKAEDRDAEQAAWRQAVTVRMLLAHSSGLPAHRKLYLEAQGRKAVTTAAMRLRLEAAPMQRALYSDIGFILLGELLERIAGERLDSFCQREVLLPLNINLRFVPQLAIRKHIPPTVHDRLYRGRAIQGEVNDENASAMGGIAGHAGLFGDACSVARFAACMLRGGAPIFQAGTVSLFTSRQAKPQGSSRALGWDTPSAPSQSGTRFSERSFGHLGYTGTSLWCDPERGLSVTLLTNRTWPDARNQAIKEVRPPLHDAILGALETE